jgi:hypothetical protein
VHILQRTRRIFSYIHGPVCIVVIILLSIGVTRNVQDVNKLCSLVRIYKIIILHVVLYGCETWFLTLREEPRLRVFENRVLRRIF